MILFWYREFALWLCNTVVQHIEAHQEFTTNHVNITPWCSANTFKSLHHLAERRNGEETWYALVFMAITALKGIRRTITATPARTEGPRVCKVKKKGGEKTHIRTHMCKDHDSDLGVPYPARSKFFCNYIICQNVHLL